MERNQLRNIKIYLFTTLKKLCAIIGYRSTKYLVSFSKVPVKLRKLNQQNIVLYIKLEHLLNQYWWTFVLVLFFGVLVSCVSSVFGYLASFWEYQLDNLRVFFGLPTESLGMLSSVYKWRLFFIALHPVFAVINKQYKQYLLGSALTAHAKRNTIFRTQLCRSYMNENSSTKVNTIHMKAKWFQPRILSWHETNRLWRAN